MNLSLSPFLSGWDGLDWMVVSTFWCRKKEDKEPMFYVGSEVFHKKSDTNISNLKVGDQKRSKY